MAVFADIEEEGDPLDPYRTRLRLSSTTMRPAAPVYPALVKDTDLAHTLRCYPVAENVTAYLDLIDLEHLSLSCRSIHDALVQYAHQLKQHSLRCSFEHEDEREQQEREDENLATQIYMQDYLDLNSGRAPAYPLRLPVRARQPTTSALGLHGKTSRCARDLVAPCQRCGIIVCRNCIEKAPSNKALIGRLRRLCDTCNSVPLILHEAPLEHKLLAEMEPGSGASSTRSGISVGSSISDHERDEPWTIEELAGLPKDFLREPCSCATKAVYLCKRCGHDTKYKDEIYHRVWMWRSRYSTHIGGSTGTGLGQGDQGQKCGRGKYCLAEHDTMALVETELPDEISAGNGGQSSQFGARPSTGYEKEPGYLRQEVEGIGGVVKCKSLKLVKVGAIVHEFRDERESKQYLGREAGGQFRSWCSWCMRVCPSKQDRLTTSE